MLCNSVRRTNGEELFTNKEIIPLQGVVSNRHIKTGKVLDRQIVIDYRVFYCNRLQ